MSEQIESFTDDVGELLARRIKDFAAYMAREWKIDPANDKELEEIGVTADQADGWNRCCDSAEGAAALWLEEFGY